jgi:hypothetical protein
VDPAGGAPAARPPPSKIGKNMICWRKIVIFHTKYPKKIRASLRLAAKTVTPPPFYITHHIKLLYVSHCSSKILGNKLKFNSILIKIKSINLYLNKISLGCKMMFLA